MSNKPSIPATSAKLWNPSAAVRWSILFTPLFGIFLHMKNWKSLGEEGEARKSFHWMLGIGALLAMCWTLAFFFRDVPRLQTASQLSPFLALMAWSYFGARRQNGYVNAVLGGRYERRGWFKPVFICLILFISLAAGLFVILGQDTGKAHEEGLAFGQTNDVAACYQASMNRMQSCAGMKCEMNEMSFAQGCAKTAARSEAFCQEHAPSSLIDTLVKLNETCEKTKFSEKGCQKTIRTYARTCSD